MGEISNRKGVDPETSARLATLPGHSEQNPIKDIYALVNQIDWPGKVFNSDTWQKQEMDARRKKQEIGSKEGEGMRALAEFFDIIGEVGKFELVMRFFVDIQNDPNKASILQRESRNLLNLYRGFLKEMEKYENPDAAFKEAVQSFMTGRFSPPTRRALVSKRPGAKIGGVILSHSETKEKSAATKAEMFLNNMRMDAERIIRENDLEAKYAQKAE